MSELTIRILSNVLITIAILITTNKKYRYIKNLSQHIKLLCIQSSFLIFLLYFVYHFRLLKLLMPVLATYAYIK